jgi:phage tail-like protein
MANTTRTDPLRNFKFRVELEPKNIALDDISLGFAVVSGLTVQNEMISYREGGMNTHPHKMVGLSDFGPITLSRGTFAGEMDLYKWQKSIHTWSQGGALSSSGASDYRYNATVYIYDHPTGGGYDDVGHIRVTGSLTTAAKLTYKIYNCWPSSFSLGDLNAGDSSILIQQMVLNHEGFEIVGTTSDDPEETAEVPTEGGSSGGSRVS